MAVLVLKTFHSDLSNPDESGCYVKISARQPGLIAWLMSVIRIDPTTTLRVRGDSIEFEEASLGGNLAHFVPINKISSVTSGYARPLAAAVAVLFLGVSLRVGAASVHPIFGLVVFLVGLLASLAVYLLNRTLRIGFSEVGGHAYSISFKSSVIEGQKVDSTRSRQACDTIVNLIRAANPS